MAKKDTNAETTVLATVDEKLAAAQGMIQKGTSANLQAGFEGMIIEEVVKLDDGQMMRGIYRGPGGTVDVTNPATGEVGPVGTWRVQHPTNEQVVALILGCAKLNRFFGGIPIGSEVTIVRRGSVRSNSGRVVNDYVTGHIPPLSVGEVIDVQAS